jgi:hypothetical protein
MKKTIAALIALLAVGASAATVTISEVTITVPPAKLESFRDFVDNGLKYVEAYKILGSDTEAQADAKRFAKVDYLAGIEIKRTLNSKYKDYCNAKAIDEAIAATAAAGNLED